MTAIESRVCPSDETLSAFIDGRLQPNARREVLSHVTHCARCRFAVEMTEDMSEPAAVVTPIRNETLHRLAVAAAMAIVIGGAIVLLIVHRRSGPDELHRLAAAMPTTMRTVEPRLTGGFSWAPPPEMRRSRGPAPTAEELIAAGAAGTILQETRGSGNPASLHAAGVAYLFTGDTRKAVETLENIARRRLRDADVWSDLSAALYCDAAAHDESAQFRRALQAADRAIELNPKLTEAYFNRGLILDRIGTDTQERSAWNQYLSRDPASGWAAEARIRLNNIPSRNVPDH
jgi:tetratricopeptide (TPR) repeat protein